MKIVKLCFAFFLLLALNSTLYAEEIQVDTAKPALWETRLFNYSSWYRPFWADLHSTITYGEVSWALNSDEYNYGHSSEIIRPYVFSNIGADLPIWTMRFGHNNKFGFGVTLPFFIDVWMDFFERSTAPVINTAYRFGMPEVIFIHHLEEKFMGIRNYSIKFTPMKHECTHIGDELTISRIDDSMNITRVNVSYNYWEIGATINDPDGSTKANHAFRFGFMRLLDPNKGWYNIVESEGDVSLVPTSKLPCEWYFQYQYQSNTSRKTHLQFIASGELRNRVRYGYPFTYKKGGTASEKFPNEYHYTNFNGMVGVRYSNPKIMKDYKVGAALHYYVGVNPYGQFRSLPFFTKFGFALLFER